MKVFANVVYLGNCECVGVGVVENVSQKCLEIKVDFFIIFDVLKFYQKMCILDFF